MAEFGVASELEVQVDERSLREARKEIEEETGDLSIPVEVQSQRNTPSKSVSARSSKERAMGRRLNARRNELLRDLDGIGDDLVDLADQRNFYLEEMLDSMEGGIGAGSGDDGGMIKPRRPRGGEGILGLLGGAIGSLALLKTVRGSSSEGETGEPTPIPVEDPGEIPYGGPNPIPVEEPGEVPVQDPGEVTVKEPTWVPIPVQSPGGTAEPSRGRPDSAPDTAPTPSDQPGGYYDPRRDPQHRYIPEEQQPTPSPDPSPGPSPGRPAPYDDVPVGDSPIGASGIIGGTAIGAGAGMVADAASKAWSSGSSAASSALGPIGLPSSLAAQEGKRAVEQEEKVWWERIFGEVEGGGGPAMASIAGPGLYPGDVGTAGSSSGSRGNRAHSSSQNRQSAAVTVNNEMRLDPTSMRDLERKLEQQKRDILQEVRREFGL